MGFQEHDQRVHDQRDREEGAEEHTEKPCVAQERVEPALADGVRHEAHDAERRKLDDPLHDFRHAFGDVGDEGLGGRRSPAKRDAEQHRPCEDADIVRLADRVHRIVHDGQQQVPQNLDDAAGRRNIRVGDGKLQLRREQERRRHGDQCGAEGADHIKHDDRTHGRVAGGRVTRHRVADEHKDENRSDAFQRADKQFAENGEHRNRLRDSDRQCDTDDEAACDQPNQRRFHVPVY